MRCLVAIAVLFAITMPAQGQDFALRNGDTVVFLGDSITAARTYGKIIETYTLLRFPERKIRFFNAGRGGDTAAGCIQRLDSDVFIHLPTVVIVAFGMNDIGWGLKADDEHKKKYLDGVREIIARCQKRKARVYICSAAVTGADPAKTENDFLQQMCDQGMELSRKLGEHAIDVQRTMRGIQKRIKAFNEKVKEPAKKTTLHAADGVHLNDLGQLAMAYAILKGLDAPADVSSASLDAQDPKKVITSHCKISDIVIQQGRFEFTRLDARLPFNYGLFYALNFAFVPMNHELNRYMLQVENLREERYELTVDERKVGVFTRQQLAKGVNLASATGDAWQPGGPWDAQAQVVKSLTEARHDLATAKLLANAYIKQGPVPLQMTMASLRTDEELIAMQRLLAQPRPYRYVLTPVKKKE
jgi:lysophospholipase L1-like esterase